MLRLFLKARGELGRVEGPSALQEDLFNRNLMHREIAERTWNAVPQSSRDYYQAFADGINRYIQTHPQEKQAWYWKVEAQDATYCDTSSCATASVWRWERWGAQAPSNRGRGRMPMPFRLRAAPTGTPCCTATLICRGMAKTAWAMRCI